MEVEETEATHVLETLLESAGASDAKASDDEWHIRVIVGLSDIDYDNETSPCTQTPIVTASVFGPTASAMVDALDHMVNHLTTPGKVKKTLPGVALQSPPPRVDRNETNSIWNVNITLVHTPSHDPPTVQETTASYERLAEVTTLLEKEREALQSHTRTPSKPRAKRKPHVPSIQDKRKKGEKGNHGSP
jgi:hypothetical protein